MGQAYAGQCSCIEMVCGGVAPVGTEMASFALAGRIVGARCVAVQSGPAAPTTHLHAPVAPSHVPRPEQSRGHRLPASRALTLLERVTSASVSARRLSISKARIDGLGTPHRLIMPVHNDIAGILRRMQPRC